VITMLNRSRRLSLVLLPDSMAICRLPPSDPLPAWATGAAWWSITRTPDELSIVCPEAAVPREIAASRGWSALRFEGPVPLDQTGILASVTAPLAAAHVSLFSVGTYDTDYVLVPAAQRNAAIAALEGAGHKVGAVV
jgi:uncharacterized protein